MFCLNAIPRSKDNIFQCHLCYKTVNANISSGHRNTTNSTSSGINTGRRLFSRLHPITMKAGLRVPVLSHDYAPQKIRVRDSLTSLDHADLVMADRRELFMTHQSLFYKARTLWKWKWTGMAGKDGGNWLFAVWEKYKVGENRSIFCFQKHIFAFNLLKNSFILNFLLRFLQ